MIVCGISTGFPVLFPTLGQITHVLLTRAPLYSGSCPPFLARLACVRHAASVRSEPGSNSPVKAGARRRERHREQYELALRTVDPVSTNLALFRMSAIARARRRGRTRRYCLVFKDRDRRIG